jgi:hypothetical protein
VAAQPRSPAFELPACGTSPLQGLVGRPTAVRRAPPTGPRGRSSARLLPRMPRAGRQTAPADWPPFAPIYSRLSTRVEPEPGGDSHRAPRLQRARPVAVSRETAQQRGLRPRKASDKAIRRSWTARRVALGAPRPGPLRSEPHDRREPGRASSPTRRAEPGPAPERTPAVLLTLWSRVPCCEETGQMVDFSVVIPVRAGR